MKSEWAAVYSLWSRELKRFYRQPSRMAGALASPLVFWLLIGSGLGNSFRSGGSGGGYLAYFFPGTLLLILLFTSIFSTISLIEDKREGFLQSVLVAPVSRMAIVLGKVLGGASIAVCQGILFLAIVPLLGVHLAWSSWPVILGVLILNAVGMTALGFAIAWRMSSIQGFHAVMNLFLMPLWLLSGALFPGEGAPAWIRTVIHLNPVAYGLAALRRVLYGNAVHFPGLPGLGVSLAVMTAFTLFLLVFCAFSASKRRVEDFPS